MSGGISLAARLLALAFFLIVGAGVYAMMLRSNLQAAEVQLANLAKDRDLYKLRAEQYVSQTRDDARSLQQCQAQVTDLQAQVEAAAAARRPPARR